jgi:hypothetical protein
MASLSNKPHITATGPYSATGCPAPRLTRKRRTLDALALRHLSIHYERNVSLCELSEHSAVRSSFMRSLVLLESIGAVAVGLCEPAPMHMDPLPPSTQSSAQPDSRDTLIAQIAASLDQVRQEALQEKPNIKQSYTNSVETWKTPMQGNRPNKQPTSNVA